MAGRQSKLTPEVQKRICKAIAEGNYLEAAAVAGGIDNTTLCRWMVAGENKPGPYREFRHAVLKAQAEAETAIVKQWRGHMPENWQACRDFLARRFPERWAEKSKHEHSGPDGGAIRVEVILSEDERLAALDRLHARLGHRLGQPPVNGQPVTD